LRTSFQSVVIDLAVIVTRRYIQMFQAGGAGPARLQTFNQPARRWVSSYMTSFFVPAAPSGQ
jgi:hypothetical protein